MERSTFHTSMENTTAIDTITSYFNVSQSFDENSTKVESVRNAAKVDYIGYVTTPLFFFVGVIGEIYFTLHIALYLPL